MKKIALFFIIGICFNVANSQELRAIVRPENLWGVINQENEFIVDTTFDGRYSNVFKYLPPSGRWKLIYFPVENLFKFRERTNFGFIDTRGNVIIPAIFDEATDFKNGYAIVKQSIKYGIIDKKGDFLFDPVKYKIVDFTEGMALIQTTGFKSGFFNSDGEVVIKTIYKEALPFREGLACVKY